MTLDELRKAIEAVPLPSINPPMDMITDLRNERVLSAYQKSRAEAWRAAFEWRDTVYEHSAEFHDGYKLIRENLK